MLVETLTGGARRFVAEGVSFVVARVRPGVLLVVAAGSDLGQFGDRVLAEVTAELERFPIRMQLFVDARRVDRVVLDARSAWTSWLERHRDRLQRVQMLTATPHIELVAAIAGHYSRAKLVHQQDPAAFDAALEAARETWPAPRADALPVKVRRARTAAQLVLDDGKCRHVFRRSGRALLLAISGEDHGTLSSDVFDEIRTGRRDGEPLDLFIDLRGAVMPSPTVSRLWSAWFSAHRDGLSSVWILSTSKAVSLTADIAGWRSQTGGLVRVVADAAVFEDAVARAAPQLAAP